MFLQRVALALTKAKVPYALVGGFAVALHGAIRGTMDVDLVLKFSSKDFEKAEAAFQSIGLKSLLPVTASQVFNFREDYIKNRNLIAWSFYNPARPSEVVDVIITKDLSNIKIEKVSVGSLILNIASIEDLIEMKNESARPQDLQDIEALQLIRALPKKSFKKMLKKGESTK